MRYRLRTLLIVVRVFAILALLAGAAVGCVGFYCNAWIAQAGNPGPFHNDYLFASRFYGALAVISIALAIGTWIGWPHLKS